MHQIRMWQLGGLYHKKTLMASCFKSICNAQGVILGGMVKISACHFPLIVVVPRFAHFIFVFVQASIVFLHHVVARARVLVPLHGFRKFWSNQFLGEGILWIAFSIYKIVSIFGVSFYSHQHYTPIVPLQLGRNSASLRTPTKVTWLLAFVRLAHNAINSLLCAGVHQIPNISISTRQFFNLFQHPAASRWYGWHSTW